MTVAPSPNGIAINAPQFTSSTGGTVPSSGGGTTNFLRADGTWAAAGGGGSPVDPTGYAPYMGVGSGVVMSPVAGETLFFPVVVPAPGWTVPGINLLSYANGGYMTACFYSTAGSLVTNGQGSTILTPGSASVAQISFTSLTLTPGTYLLAVASSNTSASLYASLIDSSPSAGWTSIFVNTGLNASTYLAGRGPTGSNLATGTNPMTCPSTIGTRTWNAGDVRFMICLLYTSPSPRD